MQKTVSACWKKIIMIAIIDYNAGNIRSVMNALRRLGHTDYLLTSSEDDIRHADRVLLPGVGDAGFAMAELRKRGLNRLIPTLTQPVLGICVGLQLMCEHSEESNTQCMGIFPAQVRRFSEQAGIRVPHTGWDSITGLSSPLFKGLDEGSFVYFVHSFYAESSEYACATCDYSRPFSAALHRDNFFATQFHPEKSGPVGARILKNFLEL